GSDWLWTRHRDGPLRSRESELNGSRAATQTYEWGKVENRATDLVGRGRHGRYLKRHSATASFSQFNECSPVVLWLASWLLCVCMCMCMCVCVCVCVCVRLSDHTPVCVCVHISK